MTIRDELLTIKEENADGILHCREVIAWAKKRPNSALHSAIEWEDDKAADAYRLDQVRSLIRLYITSGEPTERVVSLSIDRTAGGGYRSLSDVAERPDLREVLLQDALTELERVQQKYERVQELSSVWREAELVREQRGRKKRATKAEPQPMAAAAA